MLNLLERLVIRVNMSVAARPEVSPLAPTGPAAAGPLDFIGHLLRRGALRGDLSARFDGADGPAGTAERPPSANGRVARSAARPPLRLPRTLGNQQFVGQ